MMQIKYNTLPLFFTLLALLLAPSLLYGQSFQEVKANMAARIPAINALKAKGIVGENNKGLLEFRKSSSSDQQLVGAENKDRNLVYGAIAKKQGVSASLVGQRRAKAVAAKGTKGQWFQNEAGQWYQK